MTSTFLKNGSSRMHPTSVPRFPVLQFGLALSSLAFSSSPSYFNMALTPSDVMRSGCQCKL